MVTDQWVNLQPHAVSVVPSGGTAGWTGTANVLTEDGYVPRGSTCAISDMGANERSSYLVLTDFRANIPATKVLTSIGITMYRKTDYGYSVYDDSICVVKNGQIGSKNLAKAAAWITDEWGWDYDDNTWGESWTIDDLNSSNFGFAISVRAGGVRSVAYVDYVQAIIRYTDIQNILNAVAITNSRIDLSWTNYNAYATFYVERSLGGSTWTQLCSISRTSYSDTGLSANTKYYYRVKSYTSKGMTVYSTVDSGTTFTDGQPFQLRSTTVPGCRQWHPGRF